MSVPYPYRSVPYFAATIGRFFVHLETSAITVSHTLTLIHAHIHHTHLSILTICVSASTPPLYNSTSVTLSFTIQHTQPRLVLLLPVLRLKIVRAPGFSIPDRCMRIDWADKVFWTALHLKTTDSSCTRKTKREASSRIAGAVSYSAAHHVPYGRLNAR